MANARARSAADGSFPIPAVRNTVLAISVGIALVATFWIPQRVDGWLGVALGAFAFGLLTQPMYALLHECMHGIFCRGPRRNAVAGFALAAFMPSSFHLLRFVHAGHHMSNRSKRERIEYYAEGESRLARAVFYYSVLLGLNWLGFVLQNAVFTLLPNRAIRRWGLDRNFGATLPAMSDADLRRIAIEFGAVVCLHAAFVALTPVTAAHYAAYLAANALFYSQFRYIYHYGAAFDVVEGAFDLRAPRVVSLALLNSTYHLTHHREPKVPWIHLPRVARSSEPMPSMACKLLGQWRGVLPERSQARRDGRVIAWNS